MSDEDKARAREVALPVIADYRDRGCPVPDPLPAELVREMLDWAACEPVDDDNLPLVLEELDPRASIRAGRPHWKTPAASASS